jgi:hypothetical protein
VVLSRAGELQTRTRVVATYYSNGSDPTMLVRGERTLVSYPRTRQAVAVVAFSGQERGRPVSLPGALTTNPTVAHDGNGFVLMWRSSQQSGETISVARWGDHANPTSVRYLLRASFACAAGVCILLGERNGDVVEVVFRDGAATERLLLAGTGITTQTALLPHPSGHLAVVYTLTGSPAFVLDARGDVSALFSEVPRGLTAVREHRYVAVWISEPSDYESSSYPCGYNERGTCRDLPSHYTFAFRSVSLGPR